MLACLRPTQTSTSKHELVCTDRSLLQLILFNAAQNARAHGEVGGPIAVRAWLEDAAEAAPAGGRTVEQRAHSTMHVTIDLMH